VSPLAVFKAGGAFVPLEPGHPEDRLAFMIEDTAASVILTTTALLGSVPRTSARVACVDQRGPAGAGIAGSTVSPGRRTRPDQLAYVIYTSGSTGRPKGVMCRHGGLMNLVEWHSEAYRVSAADRATQVASAGFDASICEIWPYITAGATLCIVDDEVRKAPDDLLRYVLDQGITVSFMPTQLAEAFLQTAAGTRLPLRCLLTAGDRLSTYADPEWGFAFFNNYGPTENTVASTVARVAQAPGHGGGPPIGRPIQGVQAYVLDGRLSPAPVGVPGELCLGGESLARGYLSRPELTAEAFTPDPFSDEPGRRLYRTGDLVRYLPDGSLEFLGRIDHQVKIRGHRIELGEVEAALAQHPGVAEVVVLAREREGGDRRLVAWLVPGQGKGPTAGELRRFLLGRLPEYMVPSAFVSLEALPLTPTGKVDRRALPAPDGSRPELERELVAPRTPTEQVLAGIWAQVLEIEQVGVHDGFFQLGGHSLLATQVVTRVRQAFEVEIPFRAFFDAPTVAEMAEQIDALGLLASDQEAPSQDADFMEWEL
jgi:amino acid adenylation domain-containing protein